MGNILLNGFELVPYRYEEHVEFDGVLSICIRVHLAESQFNEFKDLIKRGPFNLVRQGIDKDPRSVTVSLDGWSKDAAGVKFQVAFYDKSELLQIQTIRPLWKLVPLVVKQGQIIKQLSSLLTQKRIITEAEYETIESQVPKDDSELFRLEEDLDKYEFKDSAQ